MNLGWWRPPSSPGRPIGARRSCSCCLSSRAFTIERSVRAALARQFDGPLDFRVAPVVFLEVNVFPITVPRLRQRPDDIPLLVTHFVEKHCGELGKPRLEVTRPVIKTLQETAPAEPHSHRSLQEIERGPHVVTLERLGWRSEGPVGAAEVLGINASTLRSCSRLRKLGIRRPGRLPAAEAGNY